MTNKQNIPAHIRPAYEAAWAALPAWIPGPTRIKIAKSAAQRADKYRKAIKGGSPSAQDLGDAAVRAATAADVSLDLNPDEIPQDWGHKERFRTKIEEALAAAWDATPA